MCKYPAGLVQGAWIARADSGVLAEEVYDVKRGHDRLCVGGFFGGGALEPGESIHRDDLNALTLSIVLGGQPGFEDLFGAA